MHFIKRTSFCKTSVLHKRHNVQLAWNGCIDNPSEGLCTGDNIEERMASEIQSVRDKWSQTSAPVEFGPRPSNKKHCSGIHNYVSSIGSKKYIPVNDTIPADYYYDGGAQLEIVSSTTTPQSSYISSEPSSGAEGGVTFGTYVDVQNRALHTERATFKVCYLIAPKAAKEWDDKLNQWRDEQAQLEIDDLLIEKKEELNRFLASDQARATIERRIMEDFFGVTPIQDCGALITRLRRLFDFDSMCFSLLPSWNEMGEGCQKAFPVTLYTAKCLHFYLPIKEGMELEASILLASVNAIGWNSQFVPQLMTYINQIDNMRSTLYNRAFDPTGWDVKFDQPNGYDITPYDSNSPNWSAAHESDLNYELLGAFTINVPCGERVDPRPGLCGNEGQ